MSSKNAQGGLEQNQKDSDNFDSRDSKKFETAMGLPVRDQLQNLEDIMEQVQSDLLSSRKDLNNLLSDLNAIKIDLEQRFDTINSKMSNEKNRLVSELRRGADAFQYGEDFLNQQIQQLNQDKIKIQETTNLLDLRVEGVENDVGFRFVYD